ncbi:hypothetical protein ACHAXT_004557 [Thalassiosira profunda]
MISTSLSSRFIVGVALLFVGAGRVDAFTSPSPTKAVARITRLFEAASADASGDESIESYLQQNYPLFESLLLSKVPSIYGTLRESEASGGFTIFAPSNSVMENIDPKRKVQISDKRNEEVTEKLASYHVIPTGKVTQERLKREDWTVPKVDGVAALSIGGVLTLGGELRVGRSKSGGFLGFGAKEDGGVVIGNNDAKVLKSTLVDGGVVHEVDGFVAPDLLWRYFDQLRIPGT